MQFGACQVADTDRLPTSRPSAAATAHATIATTAKPLGEHVIAEWKVNSPAAIFIGSDSVWVPGHGDGKTTRIDPATNEVSVVSAGSAEKAPVAEGFGSVWTATRDIKLNRVDQASSEIVASIVLEDGYQDISNGVVVTDTAVWVIQNDKAEWTKIDPATNRIVSKTPWTKLIDQAKSKTTVPAGKGTDFMWLQVVGDEGGGGVVEKGLLRLDPNSGAVGSIWVDIPSSRSVVRIDPVSNAIQATIDAAGGFTPCGGIAINDDAAWVTSCSVGTLMARVDANSSTFVATIDLGGNGYNPVVINGFVWVSVDGGNAETGTLVRINPDTNTIDRVLVPSASFGGGGDIVVAGGSVWVADGYHNAVIRLPMSAFGA